jgi:signal transduction histidine kinase
MLHVLGCIYLQHDLRLVALAAILCAFASWSAVTLASRARIRSGWSRFRWTACAGTVFGAGIWATHFIAILAYRSNLPIGYNVIPTVLSIAIAVILSILAFWTVLLPKLHWLGGALLGVAIGAMHFTGMSALEGPFHIVWNGYYIASAIIAGVTLSMLAALAGVSVRNVYGRVIAAALLTLAICSLHFTGMSAAVLMPDSSVAYHDAVIAPAFLAIAVAAVGILIVGLGLAGALFDSHLVLRRMGEEARLRAHITKLETAQSELRATSQRLSVALEQADSANRAKSLFLAAMSHELRTPLNAVIGFSDMMISELLGPLGNERYRQYCVDIKSSGTHLLELINDVLDLSRLDTGDLQLSDDLIEMDEFAKATCRMMQSQADSAEVTLRSVVENGFPGIRGDKRRLRQIFINLLSNAIKFTLPGGSVELTASWDASGATIAVRDTGIGMAADDIPKALERFGQVDNSLSRKYEGVGLGLPLTRQLVLAHDGTFSLESTLNVGTLVTIHLPASRLVGMAEPQKAVA